MSMEISHIWLGKFLSKQALDEYFEEIYNEDSDDIPINKFCSDQGESFYDHDWVERSFKTVSDIKDLLYGHSYFDSYMEQVIEAAKVRNISQANVFIMADKNEFKAPTSIENKDFKLWYIGEFKCDV